MMEYEKVEGVVLISKDSHQRLNEQQLISYKSHRTKLIEWLRTVGKDPDKLEGYALDTSKAYASILDKLYRWKWDKHEGYTTDVSHDDAEEYLREMVLTKEYSASYLHNIKLGLKAYFRWLPGDEEFEPSFSIESTSSGEQPRDYLSLDERKAIQEAVLEYETGPSYRAMNPEERGRWNEYLAKRFGKAVADVTEDDYDRATSFKYTSIIYTALDAGLRPIEVGRAKTYWVDLENGALRIPAVDSSKNKDNWTVSLREESAEFLARWMEERELYAKYDDTDQLWLTRHGNPYSSSGLRPLLENVTEIAGIERKLSWYAIRHSTGTYMTREEGLAATQNQLRHERAETTMKYDQAPIEDRRNALDRMG